MKPAMLALLLSLVVRAGAEDSLIVALEKTIPMPGIEGRIDHLSLDAERDRLYVAALGSNKLVAISLADGKVVGEVDGQGEAQGVLAVPGMHEVALACGQDSCTRFFHGETLALLRTADTGDDSDNMRWDPAGKTVVVGFGEGGVAFIDPASGKVTSRVKLKGHPEAFEVDGGRVYVNVPPADEVAVVDIAKGEQVASWPVDGADSNYPMALDAEGHRLYVGCRQPPKMLVYDTESGKQVASVEISADVDDIFWDSQTRRLYLSCGEGYLDVVQRGEGDAFERIAKVATAKGARTSLFVPEQRVLYVAAPHRGEGGSASVKVYRVTGK